MKKTLLTAGIALALGVVWTAGPALAQQTTGEKIEKKAEKAGDKLERAADKTGEKAQKAADKGESKMERAGDKVESAWDKTKDKTREVKDKVKDKTSELTDKVKGKDKVERKMDRMSAKTEKNDVMAMQQALRDKGHNPGPIDGIHGPRTAAALRDYQRKEGLTATGRWDDQTAMKLGVRTSMSDKETVTPSASPPAVGSPLPTPSTPAGTSTAPPTVPEDKSAPPAKRSAP